MPSAAEKCGAWQALSSITSTKERCAGCCCAGASVKSGNFPKAVSKVKEDRVAAAIRELYEETGLVVNIGHNVGEFPVQYISHSGTHKKLWLYAAELSGG